MIDLDTAVILWWVVESSFWNNQNLFLYGQLDSDHVPPFVSFTALQSFGIFLGELATICGFEEQLIIQTILLELVR